MANATAIANFKNQMAYLPEGVRPVVDSIMRFLPPDIIAADSVGLYAFPAISTTKQDVTTTAGARPLAIIILAHAAAAVSYVQLWNVQSGSVTVGVDAWLTIPVSNTNNEVTAVAFFGQSWKRVWDTGMTIAASSASETSAAPSVPPDVWVIYG